MTNDKRYEIKLPIEGISLFQIKRWINLHPAIFRETFPPRQVNNIYFDTQDFTSFQDHLDGASTRYKLRLRWYGSEKKFLLSQLELKIKHNNLIIKEFHPVETQIDLLQQSLLAIQKNIKSDLPTKWSEMLASHQPVMINQYQREYFESADGLLRLTIDYQHHSFDQRFSSIPNIRFREPQHEVTIIELKAPEKQYHLLATVIAGFPSRANRFSKYIDSMISIFSR